MKIYVGGLGSSYDIEHLTRLFYTDAQIKQGYPRTKGDLIVARAGKTRLFCCIQKGKESRIWLGKHTAKNDKAKTRALSRFCYDCLVQFSQKRPPWGLLTGVRPVRLIHDMWATGMTDAQVENRFLNEFDTSNEKYSLAMQTARLQKSVFAQYQKNDYSLYVSIPFCPSRCSYCSFVSRTTQSSKALIQPYVEKLCEEIKDIAIYANKFSLKLKTIYIGGGTPTAISEEQLEMLMRCIDTCFDTKKVQEYTVEAGRPDCTTQEKLQIIKKYGATRLSINPQTFSDEVLAVIGRKHTAQDIIDCFEMARRIGHNNINMDLIAGLPTDTEQGFEKSLQTAISLNPENITVHTLTLKRASNIVIEKQEDTYADVAKMLEHQKKLGNNGYMPYYLYRQKNTLQNLENTGFCKKGYEGLYNIYIMEEVHTIISAGAGGVTKLCDKPKNKLDRIFNFKYPTEYINDFEEMINRKRKVDTFYASYLDT